MIQAVSPDRRNSSAVNLMIGVNKFSEKRRQLLVIFTPDDALAKIYEFVFFRQIKTSL